MTIQPSFIAHARRPRRLEGGKTWALEAEELDSNLRSTDYQLCALSQVS